jgi:macrodomain Ter protein organizer (MatP/YcbG family)
MKKTSVTLDDKVWMLVRARARREGKSMAQVINELLAKSFPEAYERPTYIASFEGDVDDLGINAERHLREGLR